MARKTAATPEMIPINFKGVICSSKYISENKTGNTSESLLARVVTVIPAFCDEFPMRKNITIKRNPVKMANAYHDFICEINPLLNWKKNTNPSRVAVK